MSWGKSRFGYVYIRDYQDAVHTHNKITPLKTGKNKGTRPLGDRKKVHITIREERAAENAKHNLGPDIVVRLYSSDIVTYKPNGEILVGNGGWISSITHALLSAVLSVRVFTHQNATWIKCTMGDMPLPHRAEAPAIFRRDADGALSLMNPVYPTVYRIKRKEAAEARKKSAPFRKYLSGLIKSLDGDLPQEDAAWVRLPNVNTIIGFKPYHEYIQVAESDDTEKWYELATWMCQLSKVGRYDYELRKYVQRVNLQRTLRSFDEWVVAAYKDTVFVQEEVKTGKLVVDKWRRLAV